MPESASAESCKACTEARLLTLRRDAEIDVVSEPMISVDVPVADIVMNILC